MTASLSGYPRLDAQVASFSPIPKRDQWVLLKKHMESLSNSSPLSITALWLDSIDRSVLLALLAKQRSEVDLLRSELKQPNIPSRKDSGIKLPEYDVETHGVDYTPSPQATPMSVSISIRRMGLSSASHRAHDIDRDTRDALTKLNTTRKSVEKGSDDRSLLPDKLSPLSPTFGPRRGLILSGTLERRKVSVPASISIPEDDIPARLEHEDRPLHSPVAAFNMDMFQRILGIAKREYFGRQHG